MMSTSVANRADEPLFEFAAEPLAANDEPQPALPSWRVLVVDDCEDVHTSTRFALAGTTLLGRRIDLVHARSAAEARAVLRAQPEFALLLLDVVMESESAGLDLVEYVRHQSGCQATRIVLRTGQAGYAPEVATLVHYDINDYKTKSELTHQRLLTTVTTALRSYQQLRAALASRAGMELIVQSSAGLMAPQGLQAFAERVLSRLDALLDSPGQGLVCARQPGAQARVLAGRGRFADCVGHDLAALGELPPASLLLQALEQSRNRIWPHGATLYLGDADTLELAVHVELDAEPPDRHLIEVFGVTLNAALRNLVLVERLQAQVYVDPLLGLPNRARFIEAMDAALAGAAPESCVAVVDIDDFASVNDLMGHAYGDRLLQAYASRLVAHFAAEVLVARISSNAFGLLGPPRLLDPARVQDTVHEPLLAAGTPHRLSVTCGFVYLRPGVQDGANWLKDVSIALKHAKRHQRGQHVVFTPDLAADARSRARLLADLQTGFAEGRLFLVYQPQLDLESQALIGLEALLRWRTADGSLVPPDRFIPVAEQSGLVLPLGAWVLDNACRTMRQLLDQGLAPARMAVNISVVQFQRTDFVAQVLDTLARHGLDGSQLELEITESVAMLGQSSIESKLVALRSHRVSIAIDDFGTGYSSLSYLDRLAFDRLKIDRAFVRQLGEPGGPRIAEMISHLGHKLGVRVLAEGIEDGAAWVALQAMGCDEGQGYHISRPMAEPELLAWLRSHRGD